MADDFPSAEILGTDISAVQPSWVPPNCKFEIDDAQLDWTFPVEFVAIDGKAELTQVERPIALGRREP